MKLDNSPQWRLIGLGFAQGTTVKVRGLTAAQLYPQMMFTSSVLTLTELEINENRKITIKNLYPGIPYWTVTECLYFALNFEPGKQVC